MAVQTPLYLQKKLVSARQDRQFLGDFRRRGIPRIGAVLVTPVGGNNSVSVAKGALYIEGTQHVDQGTYRLFNDAPLVLAHDAAVTNPRVDQIIGRVQDSAENGNVGPDIASLEIVKGAEAAGADLVNLSGAVLDINMPANWERIAYVLVRPGQNITTTEIRDARRWAGRVSHHTFGIMGEVYVPSGDDSIVPAMNVDLQPGYGARLSRMRYHLDMASATPTVAFEVRRNGAAVPGASTASAPSTPAAGRTVRLKEFTPVTLADGDRLQPWVTAITGTPKNLSVTITIEHEV